MFWLWIILGAIVVVILAILIVGSLLPKKHRASVSRDVPGSPEEIWAALTDIRALPSWHPQIKDVQLLAEANGKQMWREVYRNGDIITYELVSAEPPRRLVRRIADPKLPYGGTWTVEIAPAPGGSRVSITEDGEVYNPVFRFVSRFFLGHTATMQQYLEALGNSMRRNAGSGVPRELV
jgi:uncharacterized protein YndB with AHSA1/START domain